MTEYNNRKDNIIRIKVESIMGRNDKRIREEVISRRVWNSYYKITENLVEWLELRPNGKHLVSECSDLIKDLSELYKDADREERYEGRIYNYILGKKLTENEWIVILNIVLYLRGKYKLEEKDKVWEDIPRWIREKEKGTDKWVIVDISNSVIYRESTIYKRIGEMKHKKLGNMLLSKIEECVGNNILKHKHSPFDSNWNSNSNSDSGWTLSLKNTINDIENLNIDNLNKIWSEKDYEGLERETSKEYKKKLNSVQRKSLIEKKRMKKEIHDSKMKSTVFSKNFKRFNVIRIGEKMLIGDGGELNTITISKKCSERYLVDRSNIKVYGLKEQIEFRGIIRKHRVGKLIGKGVNRRRLIEISSIKLDWERIKEGLISGGFLRVDKRTKNYKGIANERLLKTRNSVGEIVLFYRTILRDLVKLFTGIESNFLYIQRVWFIMGSSCFKTVKKMMKKKDKRVLELIKEERLKGGTTRVFGIRLNNRSGWSLIKSYNYSLEKDDDKKVVLSFEWVKEQASYNEEKYIDRLSRVLSILNGKSSIWVGSKEIKLESVKGLLKKRLERKWKRRKEKKRVLLKAIKKCKHMSLKEKNKRVKIRKLVEERKRLLELKDEIGLKRITMKIKELEWSIRKKIRTKNKKKDKRRNKKLRISNTPIEWLLNPTGVGKKEKVLLENKSKGRTESEIEKLRQENKKRSIELNNWKLLLSEEKQKEKEELKLKKKLLESKKEEKNLLKQLEWESSLGLTKSKKGLQEWEKASFVYIGKDKKTGKKRFRRITTSKKRKRSQKKTSKGRTKGWKKRRLKSRNIKKYNNNNNNKNNKNNNNKNNKKDNNKKNKK